METSSEKKNRQWFGFWGVTLILAAAFAFAVVLFQHMDTISFQEGACSFSKKLHLYCPGCGGTRAVKYLLKGDVFRSLLSNPIPVYAGIILLRIWVALFHNTVLAMSRREKHPSWKLFYQWEMWLILVVVIGFFILRNLALVFLHWDFIGDLLPYWT